MYGNVTGDHKIYFDIVETFIHVFNDISNCMALKRAVWNDDLSLWARVRPGFSAGTDDLGEPECFFPGGMLRVSDSCQNKILKFLF